MKIEHKGKEPWVGVEATCLICGTIVKIEDGDKLSTTRQAISSAAVAYFDCPVCGSPEICVRLDVEDTAINWCKKNLKEYS